MLKASENRLRVVAPLSILGLVVTLGLHLWPTSAQSTPWKRRMRQGVVLNDSTAPPENGERGTLTADELRRLGLRPRGAGLIDLSEWPTEPPSPASVTPGALASALGQLCPASIGQAELKRYAKAIVRYSAEFSVDPWLVAALVYTQSECEPSIDSSYGTGLTLINLGMHARHVRDGVYSFAIRDGNGWVRRQLDVSEFPFARKALRSPEANIYFASAFLRVFTSQCPDIDRAFDSVPHRHPVSHFVWGDHVGDTGPEDRILTARRRLLNSYTRTRNGSRSLGNLAFVSPLDGYPRIATSGLGEPRDHGKRIHRGIDFASEYGEPVRSVAAGTVTFAGVDWERKAHIPLEPWGATLVHERHMGPRGIFVSIDHGNGVVSLYSHLARYDVKVGERVAAGQQIGEVGRTGIRDSAPHLHFGLFHDGDVLDPLKYLSAYVFPPTLTRRGHAAVDSHAGPPHARTKSTRRSRLRRPIH